MGRRLTFFQYGHTRENQVLQLLLRCYHAQFRSESWDIHDKAYRGLRPTSVCRLLWDKEGWHLRFVGEALWAELPNRDFFVAPTIGTDKKLDTELGNDQLQPAQGLLRDLPAKCRTKKPARFVFKENKLPTYTDSRTELDILRSILLKMYNIVPQGYYESICQECKYDPCLALPQESGIPLAPNFEKVLMKSYTTIPLSYGDPKKVLRCLDILNISAPYELNADKSALILKTKPQDIQRSKGISASGFAVIGKLSKEEKEQPMLSFPPTLKVHATRRQFLPRVSWGGGLLSQVWIDPSVKLPHRHGKYSVPWQPPNSAIISSPDMARTDYELWLKHNLPLLLKDPLHQHLLMELINNFVELVSRGPTSLSNLERSKNFLRSIYTFRLLEDPSQLRPLSLINTHLKSLAKGQSLNVSQRKRLHSFIFNKLHGLLFWKPRERLSTLLRLSYGWVKQHHPQALRSDTHIMASNLLAHLGYKHVPIVKLKWGPKSKTTSSTRMLVDTGSSFTCLTYKDALSIAGQELPQLLEAGAHLTQPVIGMSKTAQPFIAKIPVKLNLGTSQYNLTVMVFKEHWAFPLSILGMESLHALGGRFPCGFDPQNGYLELGGTVIPFEGSSTSPAQALPCLDTQVRDRAAPSPIQAKDLEGGRAKELGGEHLGDVPSLHSGPASYALGGHAEDLRAPTNLLDMIRPSASLSHLAPSPPLEYVSSLLRDNSQPMTSQPLPNILEVPDFEPLDEERLYDTLDTFSLLSNISGRLGKEKELEDMSDDEFWQAMFVQLDLGQVSDEADKLFVRKAFQTHDKALPRTSYDFGFYTYFSVTLQFREGTSRQSKRKIDWGPVNSELDKLIRGRVVSPEVSSNLRHITNFTPVKKLEGGKSRADVWQLRHAEQPGSLATKVRLCVDLVDVNRYLLNATLTCLPEARDIVQSLHNCRVSTFDLKSFYFSIPLSPESQGTIGTYSESGLVVWLRLLQGLSNACGIAYLATLIAFGPEAFWEFRKTKVGLASYRHFFEVYSHPRQFLKIFFDDLNLFTSKDLPDRLHLIGVEFILFATSLAGLKLQVKKIRILHSDLCHLGIFCNSLTGAVYLEPNKLANVAAFRSPMSYGELSSRLASFMALGNSLPSLKILAWPLNLKLKNASKDIPFSWSLEDEECFNELKFLVSLNVSTHLQPKDSQLVLSVDASLCTISAVLSFIDPESMQLKPIFFESKNLTLAQSRKAPVIREAWALCLGITKARPFFYRTTKTKIILTDARSVQFLLTTREHKFVELSLALCSMDVAILYTPGPINLSADAVSRAYLVKHLGEDTGHEDLRASMAPYLDKIGVPEGAIITSELLQRALLDTHPAGWVDLLPKTRKVYSVNPKYLYDKILTTAPELEYLYLLSGSVRQDPRILNFSIVQDIIRHLDNSKTLPVDVLQHIISYFTAKVNQDSLVKLQQTLNWDDKQHEAFLGQYNHPRQCLDPRSLECGLTQDPLSRIKAKMSKKIEEVKRIKRDLSSIPHEIAYGSQSAHLPSDPEAGVLAPLTRASVKNNPTRQPIDLRFPGPGAPGSPADRLDDLPHKPQVDIAETPHAETMIDTLKANRSFSDKLNKGVLHFISLLDNYLAGDSPGPLMSRFETSMDSHLLREFGNIYLQQPCEHFSPTSRHCELLSEAMVHKLSSVITNLSSLADSVVDPTPPREDTSGLPDGPPVKGGSLMDRLSDSPCSKLAFSQGLRLLKEQFHYLCFNHIQPFYTYLKFHTLAHSLETLFNSDDGVLVLFQCEDPFSLTYDDQIQALYLTGSKDIELHPLGLAEVPCNFKLVSFYPLEIQDATFKDGVFSSPSHVTWQSPVLSWSGVQLFNFNPTHTTIRGNLLKLQPTVIPPHLKLIPLRIGEEVMNRVITNSSFPMVQLTSNTYEKLVLAQLFTFVHNYAPKSPQGVGDKTWARPLTIAPKPQSPNLELHFGGPALGELLDNSRRIISNIETCLKNGALDPMVIKDAQQSEFQATYDKLQAGGKIRFYELQNGLLYKKGRLLMPSDLLTRGGVNGNKI